MFQGPSVPTKIFNSVINSPTNLNKTMISRMSEQLVVTSVGENRQGIVSKITLLIAECELNILYSRMAIVGSEFTLVTLVEGPVGRIIRFESAIAQLSGQLDLMSVIKRTKGHYRHGPERIGKIRYTGEDRPGLLSKVTEFFADKGMDLASLRTESKPDGYDKLRTKTDMTFIKESEQVKPELIEEISEFLAQHELESDIRM